jgi:hypothetical protein
MSLFRHRRARRQISPAADRKFTAVELQTLLQTEEGIQFLVTIMADARPKWWRAVQRMSLMGNVVRRREADAEMLRRFADADQATVQTIPAALRVLDADFFEPVVEAMAAVTRPPARARGARRQVKGRAPMTTIGGNSKEQLRAIVERIERLEEEKKQIGDDVREVYAEAKGNGYDVKALRCQASR